MSINKIESILEEHHGDIMCVSMIGFDESVVKNNINLDKTVVKNNINFEVIFNIIDSMKSELRDSNNCLPSGCCSHRNNEDKVELLDELIKRIKSNI